MSGVEQETGRLHAVRIDGRAVAARALVVAMGPWAARAAPWLGLPVPVEPLKGQILQLRPTPAPPASGGPDKESGPPGGQPAPGGPNSGQPARAAPWLGLPVPVEPLKGQILKLQPAPPASGGPIGSPPTSAGPDDKGGPNRIPLSPGGFGDLDDHYAAIKRSGLLYIGTSEERAGFDTTPSAAVRDRILAWGRRRLPLLARAQLVAHTACLRPLSADGQPILGPVPGLSGAFLATGHGRKGLLLAPVTGRLLAEWIVDGRPPDFDPAPFAPQRFLS